MDKDTLRKANEANDTIVKKENELCELKKILFMLSRDDDMIDISICVDSEKKSWEEGKYKNARISRANICDVLGRRIKDIQVDLEVLREQLQNI